MGQAAVDLPDPLETPSAPNLNNADDLLSQLAGDEIDRLLATNDDELGDAPADGEPTDEFPPLENDPIAPAPDLEKAPAPVEPAVAAKVEAPVVAAPAASVAPPAAPAPEPAKVEASPAHAAADAVQKDLDQLLGSDTKAQPTTETPGATEPAPASATSAVPAEPAPALVAASAEVSAAAHDPVATPEASTGAAPTEDSAQATVAAVLDAALAEANTPPPNLFVRVLEFLNSPFAAMSDEARESFGKIAIITTVNAIAILLYVILFRRH